MDDKKVNITPKVNSIFLYGDNGICKITEIRSIDFYGVKRDYYILKPLNNEKSTIFVPVNNKNLIKRMRRILNPEEIYNLIETPPDEQCIQPENDKERGEHYNTILTSGSREELIGIIKTLILKKDELATNKKKLRSVDETMIRRTSKLLYNEFSLVLDMTPDDIIPFVFGEIKCREKIDL